MNGMERTGLERIFSKWLFNLLRYQTLFSVSEPDVFQSPSGETFVIFGEPKVDQGSSALAQAAASAGLSGAPGALGEEDAPALVDDKAPAASGDDTEFAAKDIDLVMDQGNCNRDRAIEALRKTKGDIVTAILDLTVSN